jgi:protein SCO1/2
MNTPAQADSELSPKKVPIYKNIYVLVFLVSAVVLTLIRPFLRRVPEAPPSLGALPEFQLQNQEGVSFGKKELLGHVHVVSFIFTQCETACPLISARMAELQKKFQDGNLPIRLLSLSVDPEADTPEKLKSYGEKFNADFNRWSFVTGERGKIVALLEEGFRLPVGDKVPKGPLYDIAHSAKFTLIDAKGELRGYYDATEVGVDEIFHRSQHVLSLKD